MQAMANLLRVRSVVQQTLARQDAERTNQFLYAASQGDVAKIRQVSLSCGTILGSKSQRPNCFNGTHACFLCS